MESKLAKIPLFSDLNESELNALIDNAIQKRYPKNSILINEGDLTNSLYIILSGRVKVFVSDDDGREVILSIMGVDQFFGEMSLIDDHPRSASVMTMEVSKFLIISKQSFDNYLKKHPEIAIKLLKSQTQRVRMLTENVKDLALLDVYGRVARTLLNMAKRSDNELVIEHRLTHQDLAKRVGASREMVSRIMKDLSLGGYITHKGKIIMINENLPVAW